MNGLAEALIVLEDLEPLTLMGTTDVWQRALERLYDA